MMHLCRPLLAGSLIFFTLGANASLAPGHDKQLQQLEQTKLGVIKELAEHGVEEAFLMLAKLSESRAVLTPLPDEELVHWYTQAAQNGRPEAMLWLGHYFLHGPGHKPVLKHASLKLLASSAILGSLQATNDLVLIPKMMAIDYANIDRAFHDAIIQLKSNSPIECAWLKCKTRPSPIPTHLIQGINRKSTAFEAGQRAANVANHYQYIKQLGLQEIGATIRDTSLLEARLKRLNSGKIKKIERITKEKRAQARPSWKHRTYLDRVASRRQGAKDTLEHYTPQDLLALGGDIHRLLELINFHREPNAQVSYEEALEITGMKP